MVPDVAEATDTGSVVVVTIDVTKVSGIVVLTVVFIGVVKTSVVKVVTPAVTVTRGALMTVVALAAATVV